MCSIFSTGQQYKTLFLKMDFYLKLIIGSFPINMQLSAYITCKQEYTQ